MLEPNHIYNMDCKKGLELLDDESIDLLVTSPPYYNAREYSNYDTLEAYIDEMKKIFTIVYQKLKNYHYCVVNVGDITTQVGKSHWSTRKIPLGAYFIGIMESIGYIYIDDYIWDKGEPQSKRNFGNPPYPFYQYPINCYEHILIFCKHKLDKTKIPCPECHKTMTVSNSCTGIGIQSWECKNPDCPSKSPHGRGKRFSQRSVMMNDYRKEENIISREDIKKWRKDIVRINPVIKINCKGKNLVGHTAPYPIDIPDMAIRFYNAVGDLVADPFMGSGTTAVSAVKNNRQFIGFELNKEYCSLANERLEQAFHKSE